MMNKPMLPLAAAISAAAMSLLSGCATYREAQSDIRATDTKSTELMKKGLELSSPASAITMDNSVYIGGSMFKVSDADDLPGFMNESTRFVKPDPVTFPEIISRVSEKLGKRVTLTSDATEFLNGTKGDESGSTGSGAPHRGAVEVRPNIGEDSSKSAAMDPLAILNSVEFRAGGLPGADITFTMDYTGTVKGLLDNLAFKSNLFWKWDNGEIVFYRRETRTYTLDALPGTNSFAASVSSARDSDDAEGGVKASSSHTTDLKYAPKGLYEEISNEIKTIISKDASFAISEQTGTVTVTDTPRNLDKVQQYILKQNGIINKQIGIRTEVYEVTRNDSDDYAMDLNMLYSGSKKYGFSLINSGISDSNKGSNLGMTILNPNSNFADSKAMLNAISAKGSVQLTTSNSVYTVNGQPVPVQVADEIHYLKKISKTQATTEGQEPTYELEPGMVMSGFSMSILPRITSTGEIMMQFAVDISKLNSLDSITVGDEMIQLPNRSTKNFLQRVNIKSGQTLMLAGFERTESDTSGSGPGSSMLWPFGGKISGSKKKVQTVIVMTPYIMSR
jgi:type IVB pilus formation R64 PilN family outer membrane protein